MLRRILNGFSFLVLTISLAACGGGGGGSDDGGSSGSSGGSTSSSGSGGSSSSSSSGGTPAPTTYNPYLPASDDIRLYYNNLAQPARFTGDLTINGQNARVLTYVSGGKHYFQSTEQGIYFLGYYAPQLYVEGVGTYDVDIRLNQKILLWQEGLQADDTIHPNGDGSANISPTYGQREFDYTAERVYLGDAVAQTPFGELPAKQVALQLEIEAKIDGTTVIVQTTNLFYFIKGIGLAVILDSEQSLELTDFSAQDSDNDGVPDTLDQYPEDPGKTFDSDGDGIANEEDPDDDNDGVLDGDDAYPLDPERGGDNSGSSSSSSGGSSSSSSSSGGSSSSSSSSSSGGGSSGGSSSSSSSGGGVADSDGDGVNDDEDAFPNDPDETTDTDGDGVGNNADTDDDGDGVTDEEDAFPLDETETEDFDGDGIGNNADGDDDGDSVADVDDYYPLDGERWSKLTLVDATHNVTYIRGSSQNSFSFTSTVDANELDWQLADLTGTGISADVTSGSGDTTIQFTVDMTQVGNTTDAISLAVSVVNSDDAEDLVFNFDIQLPAFSVQSSNVVLDAQYGWDTKVLSNQVSLNTGTNTYATDVNVDFPIADAWQPVAAFNAGSTVTDVDIDLLPSYFSEGTYDGTVTLTAEVDGETITASYDIQVLASKHLLVAHDNGIGFANFPGTGQLQQSVLIDDSYFQDDTNWSASTEAAWLTIDASGTSGNAINITADPTGLEQDTLHEAEILISSSNGAIENSETIYVSLWNGSADPATRADVSATYEVFAADSLRPYVYAASGNSVEIYNAYSASTVDSFTLALTAIDSMAVSGDGQFLYAMAGGDGKIAKVELSSGNYASEIWDLGETFSYGRFGRINGQAVLLLHQVTVSKVLDADNGAEVAANIAKFTEEQELDVSENGRVFCTINEGSSPYTLLCFDAAFSSLNHQLTVTQRPKVPHGTGSNGKDVAVTKDGSVVYAVGGGPYVFTKVDVATGSVITELAAGAYPTAVEIGVADRLHGAISRTGDNTDYWIYDADDNIVWTADATPNSGYEDVQPAALQVSADGLIAVVQTDTYFVFVRNY